MRLEEFEKQEHERLERLMAERKKARQAEAARLCPYPGKRGQPRTSSATAAASSTKPYPRRRPGPAKKSPAREWLGTAAWTAAGLQGVGLFCTLSLLADSKSLYLQVGRERLAKLLHCSPSTVGRYLLQLDKLGMIKRKCQKKATQGGVRSLLHVWIQRPAAAKGEHLPGLSPAVQGCAPAGNEQPNEAAGEQG